MSSQSWFDKRYGICFVCRNFTFPVCDVTYLRIVNMSNTMGVNSEAGTAYRSTVFESFTLVLVGVAQLVFCVVFCLNHWLFFVLFLVVIVLSVLSIYSFWWPFGFFLLYFLIIKDFLFRPVQYSYTVTVFSRTTRRPDLTHCFHGNSELYYFVLFYIC